MIYTVTFETPAADRLIGLIKAEKAWARLTGGTYLVKSDLKAVRLRDKYKAALAPGDKLYIGQVSGPAAWVGLSDIVSRWIKNNLNW